MNCRQVERNILFRYLNCSYITFYRVNCWSMQNTLYHTCHCTLCIKLCNCLIDVARVVNTVVVAYLTSVYKLEVYDITFFLYKNYRVLLTVLHKLWATIQITKICLESKKWKDFCHASNILNNILLIMTSV